MTDYILKHINNVKQLSLLSDSYLKGMIKLNISKLAKNLKVDRKTVRRYLNGITSKAKYKSYKDDFNGIVKSQLLNKVIDIVNHKKYYDRYLFTTSYNLK